MKNIKKNAARKVGGPQGFRRTALDPTGVSPWSFTVCNVRRYENVGQALPDNKGRSLRPLRSLARSATYSAPLAGEVRRSRVGGLLKNISTIFEKVGVARMRGLSSFNLINPSPALRASSPARGEEIRGFTLIELLVVVLIIGILAAVALPQYQKAVDKTGFTQIWTIAQAVGKAQETYYLANGTYATSLDALDIDVSAYADRISLRQCSFSVPNAVYVYHPTLAGLFLLWGYSHQCGEQGANQDSRKCYAPKDNKRANKLCAAMTGQAVRDLSSNGTCNTGNFCSYRF